MKSVVFVISLLLAFSSSCTSQLLQVVRDTDGDILKRNTRYFVVARLGGGVTRGPINGTAHDANFVCPSQVVLSPIESIGMSVYFKPKAHKQVEITESSDVNIEFYLDNPTVCNNSVWEVEDEIPMFLSTNGTAGKPFDVATWFQIKKVDDLVDDFSYKLVFCPYGEYTCTDIGIKMVDGERPLGIGTGNTLFVEFIKDTFPGIKSII